ncbi:MAG: hypothetical protein H7069_00625 [Phormidesmis sp. FL-bin-119]|nr:hypothetical protein [Pedobacter sp.]
MEKTDLYSLFKEDEINLKDIAAVVKAAVIPQIKKVIVIFVFFILLGFLDYTLSPIEYKSEATVLLEGAGASANDASASAIALAGLLGGKTSANTSGGAVSPEMYGQIVATTAFLNALVISKIPTDATGKDSTTLEQYFANGAPLTFSQKISHLPTYAKNIFSKPTPIKPVEIIPLPQKIDTSKVVQNEISAEMFFSSKVPPLVQLEGLRANVIGIVKQRIKVDVSGNSASVSVELPDSFLAAAVNKLMLQQLIDYVTAYNTIKQRTNIVFLEKRFQETKADYTSKQQRLAGVKDNSYGLFLQSTQSRQEMLSNELGIAYNIYNQFAVQLEEAKINLKKETPLFTVMEPISLPSPQVQPVLFTKVIKYISYAFVFTILLIGYRILFPKKIQ